MKTVVLDAYPVDAQREAWEWLSAYGEYEVYPRTECADVVPRCFLTPHIAWATKEARLRLMDICRKNVAAFVAGHPINLVG